MMRRVVELIDADLWPTIASAYEAAREYMSTPAGDGVAIRPVPVAGRFALQLENPRPPRRVVGYLAATELPRD